MSFLRKNLPKSKNRYPQKSDYPAEVINTILWRYGEIILWENQKHAPYNPKIIPKDLDKQIWEQIDVIMGKWPQEIDRMEEELLRIRIENDNDNQLMVKLQEEETQKNKMLRCYKTYTWYLQKQQFQTAIKYFKTNSDIIIEWYVLFLDDESLSNYISILSATVNTKSIFNALPRFYTQHLFIDTLILILRRRPIVVEISQDAIRKITPFFPEWNQFILPEKGMSEI